MNKRIQKNINSLCKCVINRMKKNKKKTQCKDVEMLLDIISVRDLLWMQLLYRDINDSFFDEIEGFFEDGYLSGIERGSIPVHLDDWNNEEKRKLVKELKNCIKTEFAICYL